MYQWSQEVKLGSRKVPVFGVMLATAGPVGGPVISHAVLLAMGAGARTGTWELNPARLGSLVRDFWPSKQGMGRSKYRRPVLISEPPSTVWWPWRAYPIGSC